MTLMAAPPELPGDWQVMLQSMRRLSENGTNVRFGEEDERIICDLSERYSISKALVVRILVHQALGG